MTDQVNQKPSPTVPVEAATEKFPEKLWTTRMGPHCFIELLDGDGKVIDDSFHDYEAAEKVAEAHNATLAVAESVEAEALGKPEALCESHKAGYELAGIEGCPICWMVERDKALGKPEAKAVPVRPTGQNERQHILPSAAYWFKAARIAQSDGCGMVAASHMENAYNHVENALAACNEFIRDVAHGVLMRDGKTESQRAFELLSQTGGSSNAVSVSSPNPLSSHSNVTGAEKESSGETEADVNAVEPPKQK